MPDVWKSPDQNNKEHHNSKDYPNGQKRRSYRRANACPGIVEQTAGIEPCVTGFHAIGSEYARPGHMPSVWEHLARGRDTQVLLLDDLCEVGCTASQYLSIYLKY